MSHSHIQVRDINQWENFFQQRTKDKEEGWLNVKEVGIDEKEHMKEYHRKWATLEDGKLKFCSVKTTTSNDTHDHHIATAGVLEKSDDIVIDMKDVVSLTSKSLDGNRVVIKTKHEDRIYLRADAQDEMSRWTFAFQKSVALVLSQLLKSGESRDRRIRETSIDSHGMASVGVQDSPGNLFMRTTTLNPDLMSSRQRSSPEADSFHYKGRSVSSSIAIPYEKSSSAGDESAGDVMGAETLNTLQQFSRLDLYEETSDSDDGDDLDEVESEEKDADSGDMLFDMDGDEDDERRGKSSSSGKPRRMSSTKQKVINNFIWEFGKCSIKGGRDKNEDRLVAIGNWKLNYEVGEELSSSLASLHQSGQRGFFAVYDGHCGDQASVFLEDALHNRIATECEKGTGEFHEAISRACINADEEFLEFCRASKCYAGSTALGVILRNVKPEVISSSSVEDSSGSSSSCVGILTVFNIGDCEAVLSRGGRALALSRNHRPGRPDEKKRIIDAGGWITEEKELYIGRLHNMELSDPVVRAAAENVNWITIERVAGDLAVSRSIGDRDYKGFNSGAETPSFFNFPEGHSRVFNADLVIPDPEIEDFQILKEDEFFILATDGLWDVVKHQQSVDLVRGYLFQHELSVEEASKELCQHALKLGSSDNVSIVIVKLLHLPEDV